MTTRPARVRVVIADRGWILERMAREVESRVPGVDVDTRPSPQAELHYYMNYSGWRNRQSRVEAAYFTHIEERDEAAKQRFFHVARRMDVSVCMAQRYVQALREGAAGDVRLIVPGVDHSRFEAKLRVGVVGRNYATGRKGADLVKAVLDTPGIEWAFAGEGWPGPTLRISDGELPGFYRSLDYLLVPAYYEGGPMPALEAIACGTPVISGDVGFMPELPHMPFPAGDAAALRTLLTQLAQDKLQLAEAAEPYSWDAWGAQHGELFEELLADRASRSAPVVQRPWRVLFSIGEEEGKQLGGPSVRVRRTAEALRSMGHTVDLWTGGEPPQGSYDLVHTFNVWPPQDSLQRLERLAGMGVPVFFSPIFLAHAEWEWSWPILLEVCGLPGTTRRLTRVLKRRAHMPIAERRTADTFTTEFHDQVRQMGKLADHLICLSAHETEQLLGLGIPAEKLHLVHNGIECGAFEKPDPRAFAQHFGLGRYVLCVGRIEHRKNQALLAHALRHSRLQVALVGECHVEEYGRIVAQLATGRTRQIGRVEAESPLLASAYAGAAAFVLPSWSEGAPISALEAAACGVPLVLSDRSGESEYFGALAEYCNPADPSSIRQAVRRAIRGDSPAKRERLRALIAERFTIQATSRDLAQVYARVLGTDPRKPS